jgi:hypothetical protein
MSRRTLLPILLTPIVIVLVGVATVATGNAGAKPGGAGGGGGAGGAPWPGTSICAEGTLDFVDIDPTTMEFAGSIQPCVGTDPATVAGARWGVAQYRTQGAFLSETSVRRFDSATAPTAFAVTVVLGPFDGAIWGPLQAACLITAPRVRLACVEITTLWNGSLHIAPIPVDDPRVGSSVTVIRPDAPDPECGACV